MRQRYKDLTGQRFERLLVLERAGSDERGRSLFRVKCDCGKELVVRGCNLVQGGTTSCNCKKAGHRNALKHGLAKSPEWHAWASLRHRCRNPKHRYYKDYGARGITVCERWDSFENFIVDMGPRPSPQHSIDRIDNDRGYEPRNCRWATKSEQVRNRRPRHLWPSVIARMGAA